MTPLRARLAWAVMCTVLALSPVQVPPWRLDPSPPPAIVLTVGEPVRGIFQMA
jgi:hypothetical protein